MLRNTCLVVPVLAVVAACNSSHGRLDATDSGADAGCPGSASACGDSACTDFIRSFAMCVNGAWACPRGQVFIASGRCCVGDPPQPSCYCDRGGWQCPTTRDAGSDGPTCPSHLPIHGPHADGMSRFCSQVGQVCSGGSVCGTAWRCTCDSGSSWACAITHEPSPACTCDAQTVEGDPCLENDAACGNTCPGGTLVCVSGVWRNACPPPPCPADTQHEQGRSCTPDGQYCGDVCCGRAIACLGGSWQALPVANCRCDESESFACGEGRCTTRQMCVVDCTGAGNVTYTCETLPSVCTAGSTCDCLGPGPSQCSGRIGVASGLTMARRVCL